MEEEFEDDEANGLPFLNGKNLKFFENTESLLLLLLLVSKMSVLSLSSDEFGEVGSPGFGVLDLNGLPAKA